MLHATMANIGVLEQAIETGDLRLAEQYSANVWVLFRQQAIRRLRRVLELGNPKVICWMITTFGIVREEIDNIDGYTALQIVCEYGRLAAAQWLHKTYELTAGDARANYNGALREACSNGRLRVARWLHKTFGLNASDARSDDNYALQEACSYGSLRVVQWLHVTFGLTKIDAGAHDDLAMTKADKYGHGDHRIVQWLHVTYGLSWPTRFPAAHFQWTRQTCNILWYWRAQAIAAANRVPRTLLCDVLRRASF